MLRLEIERKLEDDRCKWLGSKAGLGMVRPETGRYEHGLMYIRIHVV